MTRATLRALVHRVLFYSLHGAQQGGSLATVHSPPAERCSTPYDELLGRKDSSPREQYESSQIQGEEGGEAPRGSGCWREPPCAEMGVTGWHL